MCLVIFQGRPTDAAGAAAPGPEVRRDALLRLGAVLVLGVAFDWSVLLAGRTGLGEATYAFLDRFATGYLEEASTIESLPVYLDQFHERQPSW